jgi:4-amino-4-deoxy-L-arabinose transferase-like glycosyltransferase
VGRVTEETARIPSAIAATWTVLFAFSTLRRFLDARKAFVASLLLPVSFLWLDKVPSAEIDMLQLAWVTTALFFFLRAYLAKEEGRDSAARACWVGALLCAAGGFLTKWTAPAFFYLAVGPFLLGRGRWRWLFGRDHLAAAAIAVALCAIWAVTVASQIGWQTLADTVAREAAQRFAPKANGKPYPWLESLTFPAVVLAAHLPWSIPALCALRPAFIRGLDERSRLVVQLLQCWAWPNVLFWSLPAQHNVRYVLPVCPAMSLLGMIVVLQWAERVSTGARQLASPRTSLLCALLAWAVVKVVFVEAVLRDRTGNRDARPTGEAIARLVPPGEILYLCRLKDEGVLFYYGRPARRFDPFAIPQGSAVYALLLDAEWAGHLFRGRPEYIAELRDQQQAPIHLVRIHGPSENDPGWPPHHFPIPPSSSPSAP